MLGGNKAKMEGAPVKKSIFEKILDFLKSLFSDACFNCDNPPPSFLLRFNDIAVLEVRGWWAWFLIFLLSISGT